MYRVRVHNLISERQLDTSYQVGVQIVNIYTNLLRICPYSLNNVLGIGVFGFFGRHDGGDVDGCLLHSAFDLGFSVTRLQALCLTACVLCGSLRDRVVWLAVCVVVVWHVQCEKKRGSMHLSLNNL